MLARVTAVEKSDVDKPGDVSVGVTAAPVNADIMDVSGLIRMAILCIREQCGERIG